MGRPTVSRASAKAAEEAVDVTADSGSDVAEIVAISDSESDCGEVRVYGTTGGATVPPLVFRGYRRGQELGRGSSGKVYVCRSRKSSASGFAVKIVDLRRIEMSPDADREQKKLRREVEILKKLPPHKNIVSLVDAFEEGHWMFFVLELVGGGDLFTVLTSRATPKFMDRETAFVLNQLVCGLGFLHGLGVIHRDLKLENILVASEMLQRPLVYYWVKITDFGLSKSVGQGQSQAQSTVGTRPYTAPEVLKRGTHGLESDLWCLGVLLYLLLAGHFPFDHSAALQQDDIDKKISWFQVHPGAKSLLEGLLRLEPGSRESLATVQNNEWLADDRAPNARPSKRPRSNAAPRLEKTSGCGSASAPVQDSQDQVKQSSVAANVAPPASPSVAAKVLAPVVAFDEPAQVSNATTTVPQDEAEIGGLRIPKGAWTPFAVEAVVQLTEATRPSLQADVVQVHVAVLAELAGYVLGRQGTRIQQIAVAAGCPVWMTSRDGSLERRVVIVGNYKQCKVAQELIHEQVAHALNADWRDQEVEVYILVRTEATGVVTGKQGFVLDRIRKHSGARIRLLRQEVEGQRPCVVSGSLQSVLRAQRFVFHLVSCVPVARSELEVSGSLTACSRAGSSSTEGERVPAEISA